jgi:capsid portal protein
MFRQADLSQFFLGNSVPLKRQNGKRTQRPWLVDTETGMVCSYCKEQNISPTGYFERTCKIKNQSEKCTIKFRNMIQQKTAWFLQYKDNREIIVVKRIICYLKWLNPFTTTTKFFISILK